jgi:hypothetical protein
LTSPHGASLGTIQALTIQSDADPAVNLYFSVLASSTGVFSISTGPVSITPIVNPQAYASAALTLTSDSNGASAVGTFLGGTKSYEADYNGSNVFTDLVSNFSIGPNTSATNSDRYPLISPNTVTIPGTVSDMTTQFSFNLGTGEQASGTSRFELTAPVPEPATMSLLVLGGMAVLARRKRMLS